MCSLHFQLENIYRMGKNITLRINVKQLPYSIDIQNHNEQIL